MKLFTILALVLFSTNVFAEGRIKNVDIASDAAITLPKLQTIAATTFLGNSTGGAAAITPMSVATAAGLILTAIDSFDIDFTPTNPGDWTTAPTNAGDALDELAARASETTTVDDTNSINMTLTGVEITSDLNLSAASPDAGNINSITSIETDGLQVQSPILIGDSGAGGVAGVVPAPAAGDAAANKYLRANGAWATVDSSPLTTKGDLYTYSTLNARLPVGTNDYLLTPDSAQATGLKWTATLPTAAVPAFTGDVTNSAGSLSTTIANDAVTNAKAANMAQATIKGRAAGAGTGDPTDLTGTQATEILDNFVGDSGSGGTKGLVPAPAAGDAAANKFLNADGSWMTVDSSPLTTKGDLYTYSTTNDRLPVGSNNQLLTPNSGQATGLEWVTTLPTAAVPAFTGDVTNSAGSLTSTIANDAVTNAKLAEMATMTIKGNDTGGTANPQDLTGTEVTAMLDPFTSTEKGLAPASGGGTANFLRADGSWATPAGAGDVSSNTATSVDGEIALFNGTSGKSIKRATGTGYAKLASGVLSAQSTPLPSADLNGGRTPRVVSGTSHTFVLADGSMAGGFPLVTFTNAAAVTAAIDTNANVAFPVGTQIDFTVDGSGAVTIDPEPGVTVTSSNGSLVVLANGAGTLVKKATDTWNLYTSADATGITSLTGDVTGSGPGSTATTLATVNGNVGSFTYGSFTVNGKGLITAASSGTAPVTSITVASANGLAGSSGGGQTPALTLSTTVTGNVCGNGTAFSACSVTGTGDTVLATSPTLVTPTLGVASATSINKVALTAPATGSTLTIADGKTFTSSNTLTLTGTDGSTLNIGTGGTLGTAAYTAASAYEVPLTFSTGLTRSTNTITVNTSQNISTLSNLTTNGYVKTTGGTGALSVSTSVPAADLPAPTTSTISASDIDWSTLKNVDGLYTKTLGANTTLTWSNVTAGQTIVIAITNTASNYTLTWPAAAKWPGGTAPTQTIGAKTDVYTCKAYDSTNAYCNFVQNF